MLPVAAHLCSKSEMINIAKIYFFVFAALTAAGGIMGYVKAQSLPSLIAGGVSGVLLAAAGFLLPQKTTAGLVLGLLVSLLLLGKFLPAVLKGSTSMAALPMCVLSAIGSGVAILTFLRR